MQMSRKKIILTIFVAILVIGGALLLMWFTMSAQQEDDSAMDNKQVSTSAKAVCDENLLERSAKAIRYPIDSEALAAIVTDIKKLEDYNRDVNCLYVVLQYNLVTSSPVQARESLNGIKGLYISTVGYSSSFGADTQSPAVLEQMVIALESRQEKFLKQDTQIKVPDVPDEE